MNPSFDLRHLRSFVAVAEELHFTRAALRLRIAQPPLSQQIRQLEAAVGAALLARTNRRVELTAAGRVFLGRARAILAAAEAAAAEALRIARGQTGELKVAFAATVLFEALPAIVRTFRDRFPGVYLDLREMATGAQLEALRAGDLDLGFVREPGDESEIQTTVVKTETLLIALGAEHPLLARRRVGVRDLESEPFVLFPREVAPGLYAQVTALCRAAGFEPKVVQTSRELFTTMSLVEAGVGVSILPASIERFGWPGVHTVPIPGSAGKTRIAAAWGKTPRRRPAIEAFLGVARERIAELGRS